MLYIHLPAEKSRGLFRRTLGTAVHVALNVVVPGTSVMRHFCGLEIDHSEATNLFDKSVNTIVLDMLDL